MIPISEYSFEKWIQFVQNVTIGEAVQILQGLEGDYLTAWITVYTNTQYFSRFCTIAIKDFVQGPQWYKIPCRFTGGPTGKEIFHATLGTFVADCILRNVCQYGSVAVFLLCNKVLNPK